MGKGLLDISTKRQYLSLLRQELSGGEEVSYER